MADYGGFVASPVRRGTVLFHQGIAILSVYHGLLHARGKAQLKAEAVHDGRMGAVPAPVPAFVRDGLCTLRARLLSIVYLTNLFNASLAFNLPTNLRNNKVLLDRPEPRQG